MKTKDNRKKINIKLIFFIILIILVIVGINFFNKEHFIIKQGVQKYNLSNANTNSELSEWQKAFQEVAYSYYMRGKNIQYNSTKIGYYSPEEATSQNKNYIVCSGFTRNVYYELFGIKIPDNTTNLLKYSANNIGYSGIGRIGRPEVIAYGYKIKEGDNGNFFKTKFYTEETDYKFETKGNQTLKDLLPYLQVGDILTYTGHTILVYDLMYDDKGNVNDAIIIEGTHGGMYANNEQEQQNVNLGAYVNIKLSNTVSSNHYLYDNSRQNPYCNNNDEPMLKALTENREEGSIVIGKLSEENNWKTLISSNFTADNIGNIGFNEYSILRFVVGISDDNHPILSYNDESFKNEEKEEEEQTYTKKIKLTKSDNSRLEYSKLYIEKTVDAHADDTVEEGEELKYTIVVKNNSDENYTKNLIISEDISEFVTYKSYEIVEGTLVSFTNDIANNKIIKWEIDKLSKGEEAIITYTVQVNKGNYGNTIISTGKVCGISSATVKNTVGSNLTKSEETALVREYNNYLNKDEKYANMAGKKLIEAIYNNALGSGFELGFSSFDITDLLSPIDITTKTATYTKQLNSDNSFSGAVLNKYWGAMYYNVKEIDKENGKEYVKEYDLKYWTDYTSKHRRADTIYSENFKTGDILLYTNAKNEGTGNDTTTKEHGQYVYIYIEGKGFVGSNLGYDNKAKTADDRNEFNADYYNNVDNALYKNAYGKDITSKYDTQKKEYFNYQTLFGKDYYVILRPSLLYNKRLEVTTLPNKTKYVQNTENIDLTGGKITINYLNGTSEKLDLTDNAVKVTGFDNSKIGKNTLTVEYDGKTTTFDVNVTEKLEIDFDKYSKVNFEEKQYLENIVSDTTLEAFVNNIETNGEISIYKDNEKITDKNVKIATGMKVKISLADENYEYVIVVKGDTNGDGLADLKDLLQINKHRLNKALLNSEYFLAGDVNKDTEVNLRDLLQINKFRLGKIDEL